MTPSPCEVHGACTCGAVYTFGPVYATTAALPFDLPLFDAWPPPPPAALPPWPPRAPAQALVRSREHRAALAARAVAMHHVA